MLRVSDCHKRKKGFKIFTKAVTFICKHVLTRGVEIMLNIDHYGVDECVSFKKN